MQNNNDESCTAISIIKDFDASNDKASKLRNSITHDEFSLAIRAAGEVLNHVRNGESQFDNLYKYVRSLPLPKMIGYRADIYDMRNSYNQDLAMRVKYIFSLIDSTKDRALGYNAFMKDIIDKIPYEIEASSVIPLLLYKIKVADKMESIRIAGEFACKISQFLAEDWLVQSAIYISQREVPNAPVMKHLGDSITCLSYSSKDASRIIDVYLEEVQHYKTGAGKMASITVTEDFVSHLNMKSEFYRKAIKIMESYIGDKDVKFQSVKVILDIFQINEGLNPSNKIWPVRLANAVRAANHKYKFIDTHPFLEKSRDGDQLILEQDLEDIIYVKNLEFGPESYYYKTNVDIYIVNVENEFE